MEFNYEVIAKMAADISKQMLKLNNQLDKTIDKQNELTDPTEQQERAIEFINEKKWDEASKLCAEQAKEEIKREKLAEEESSIRSELEELRVKLEKVALGEAVEEDEEEQSNDSDETED